MRSRPTLVWLTAAVLSAGVVYLNALDNPFVYDDQRLILENPSIRLPLRLRTLLLRDATRPLVNVSYAVDRALWGPRPFGFHLTNLLIHLVNVALVFALAWLVVTDRGPHGPPEAGGTPAPEVVAGAAALLYGVHPLLTQAVGYVSGRAELLCAMFLLLALFATRAWFRRENPVWLLVILATWVAAVACKETAAMLPVALLFFDRAVYRGDERAGPFRLLWLHLPAFTMATLAALLRLFVFAFVEHPGELAPQTSLALVELDVVRRYVGLLVFPSGQSIYHAVAPLAGFLDLRALAALAVVGGLVVLAWAMRRREPLVTFGIAWFLTMLVPSAVLVTLDYGEPMAEHRVYVAAAGAFLAVGAGWGWLLVRLRRARPLTRRVVLASSLIFVVGLGARTVLRNAVWSDPVTLWTEAVSDAPNHWLPNLALGEVLQQAGRCREAIGHFAIALDINPDEVAAYGKLGGCLIEIGSYEEARRTFEALAVRAPESTEVTNGLGAVALVTGQRDAARARYLETLARDPDNVPAHRALAVIDEPTDPASALGHCEAIARVAPETPGNDDCISRNRARLATGGSGV